MRSVMKQKENEIVCLNFQGSKGNNVVIEDGTAFNLMAMHGHDVHVVCFQQNQREEVRDMGDCAGAITAESGMHNTNYVCFQLCGDRSDPSVSVSNVAYCIPVNLMSDRGQAVCIALEGNGVRPSHMGKGFSDDGTMYTLNTIEQHSVCYEVDNESIRNRESSMRQQGYADE